MWEEVAHLGLSWWPINIYCSTHWSWMMVLSFQFFSFADTTWPSANAFLRGLKSFISYKWGLLKPYATIKRHFVLSKTGPVTHLPLYISSSFISYLQLFYLPIPSQSGFPPVRFFYIFFSGYLINHESVTGYFP